MTPILNAAPRADFATMRSELRITPRALRLLDQLRAEAGDIALLLAPRLSEEVLCIGRRDLVLGPHDALVATVRGCPIYADRRDVPLAAMRTSVLDVHTDLGGPRFVLRRANEGSA